MILLSMSDADTLSRPAPHVAVAVLARRAELGKGKRRLAATLGDAETLAIYRQLVSACAAAVADSGLPAGVFFEPAPGDADVWPPERFAYAVQPATDDLGARIAAAAEATLATYDGVLLIGTDCPELTGALLREAAGALATHDAVLGPSTDGGYYLLGIRAATPGLFTEITWSSERVAAQTRAVLAKAGLGVYELPALTDVDEEADWRAYLRRQQTPTARP